MTGKTIRRILCPIDFSDFSRHALDHAIAIAHQYDAQVTALHVFVLAVEGALFTGAAGFKTFSLSADDRAALLTHMRTFVEGEGGTGQAVNVIVRESPDIAAQILQDASALEPDLLVIGTHGRSGFDHLMLGSVTEKILRKAGCPILTIPRRMPDAVPARVAPYARILCGIDFSECSLAALSYATDFARRGAEWLGVVHSIDLSPAFSSAETTNAALAALEANLDADTNERFARLVPTLDAGAQCRVEPIVTTGRAHREIVRLGAERRADLIALGVHGRGVLDRMFFGSTTHHVIRHANCPVLTVRA